MFDHNCVLTFFIFKEKKRSGFESKEILGGEGVYKKIDVSIIYPSLTAAHMVLLLGQLEI